MSERTPARRPESASDGEPVSEFGTWDSTQAPAFTDDGSRVAHPLSIGAAEPLPVADVAQSGICIGRYQLRDELGRGGMGVVYRAYDPKLGREVALKVVRAGRDANESQNRRFSREARAVARLKHPNIVEVYDMGTYDGGVYYTMQYVDGTSLASRIAGEPLTAPEAARLAVGIARALACAHDAGLIHRDVKPGNILLDGDTPKLTDFGLVKQLDSNEATAVITRGGQMLGTPAYMAPEQLAGDSDALVPATDQYALGIILFEMLSGQRPFKGVGSGELVQRMTSPEPPRLPTAGVPRELDLIRRRAMAFAPDERYTDCADLADDLERFLTGAPVQATKPGLTRQIRWLWRRYWRRVAVTAAVIGAVIGGVQLRAAWSDWQRERAEARREAAAEARRVDMEEHVRGLLSKEDRDGADQVFQAFAAFEDNRDTRALARARLHRGKRLRKQGRAELGLNALAAAYASTDDTELQGQALTEVAAEFRAQYRWPQLAAALATMEARTPEALNAPSMRRMRLDSALAERDIGRAATLARASTGDDDAVAPLLAHLSQATASEHRAEVGRLWDADGDDRPELVLQKKFHVPTYTVADLSASTLPLRQRVPVPTGQNLTLRMAATPSILLLQTRSNWLLATPGPHGSISHAALEISYRPIEEIAIGDLDGDGRIEHHLSSGMELGQLVQGADGTWSYIAHDEVNAISARACSLLISDLDRDGRDEMFAGTCGWSRYDVQVFRAASASGSVAPGFTPLEMVARRQLGAVARMAVLDTKEERLLAVLQTHDPTRPLNHRIFPADGPQGGARGIHLLALVDGQLQLRDLIPLPIIEDERDHTRFDQWDQLERTKLTAADLDGDGRQELILGGRQHGVFIYKFTSDGQFRELALTDVELITLAQVDDDPLPEMIVNLPERDAEVWVLGAGTDALPLGPSAAPSGTRADMTGSDAEPGPVARRELSARWRRAEDLHAIGLTRAAVDQLREIGKLAVGSVDEGRALYRAGQLLAEGGDLAEAGALFTRAAASPTVAARAWEAALNAYLADMRWTKADEVAKQRQKLPGTPEWVRTSAETLNARLNAATTSFDFRDGLDPNWRVRTPLQIRTDHQGRGLWVVTDSVMARGATVGDTLLELPTTRTGEPLRVAVEFELHRVDWASYVRFYLVDGNRPPGDELGLHVLFNLHYRGGGGIFDLEVSCLGSEKHVISSLDGLLERPLRLEWQQAADGRTSCELSSEGVTARRFVYHQPEPLPRSGPMTFQLRQNAAGVTASARLLLRDVELTGFATAEQPQTPLQRAHQQLALGRPDAAERILTTSADVAQAVAADPGWQLARAVAAEALGDRATVLTMLRSLVRADSSLRGHASHLFRHHLDRFEEPLRSILGDRYYKSFSDAVEDTLYSHQREGRMLGLLRDHLDGLEALPLYPGSPADSAESRNAAAMSRLALQVWRARAWRLAGRLALAMRTLVAARTLIGQLGTRTDQLSFPHRQQLATIDYEARRELAVCYMARGERERAIDTLLAALAATPAPEVAIDKIVAAGEFRALHTHPAWRAIERLRNRQASEPLKAPTSVPATAGSQ